VAAYTSTAGSARDTQIRPCLFLGALCDGSVAAAAAAIAVAAFFLGRGRVIMIVTATAAAAAVGVMTVIMIVMMMTAAAAAFVIMCVGINQSGSETALNGDRELARAVGVFHQHAHDFRTYA